MDPSELLQANLAAIEGIAARACRRARMHDADVEDFIGSVKLALVENDYAILRQYQGRAALTTYLTIVIERLLVDERMHRLGRFHASAEATRLGPAAILLESLVRRDGRSLEEALPIVRSIEPALTREDAEALLTRIPERRARAVTIDFDSAPPAKLAGALSADAPALAGEASRMLESAAAVIRATMASFNLEDRTLVRFHYGLGMNISDISRMLRLPQRPLYRRVQSLLQRLRGELEMRGLGGTSAADILERAAAEELDLGLAENTMVRQSNDMEPRHLRERT